MTVTLKAALDGLLAQLAMEPALDLDAYREELIALFDRATSPARSAVQAAGKPAVGDTSGQCGN